MVIFVYLHNVVARRNAWNGGELESWNAKIKKPWKKRKKREKWPRVNLILSCGNHIFLISNPQIGPQAFIHTRSISRKKRFFLMWRKVQFKVQFASSWSLGFWSF
jgi:hypothetical protein